MPYVIYGDPDSIVLRNADKDTLLKSYPALLDDKLATDMLMPSGEVEVSGDIIVLGKRLYYINDKKFSCKGHNRKEVTKELFGRANQGFVMETSRMSPFKHIFTTDDKTIHTNVTRFAKQKRSLQITLPQLKKLVKDNILLFFFFFFFFFKFFTL